MTSFDPQVSRRFALQSRIDYQPDGTPLYRTEMI